MTVFEKRCEDCANLVEVNKKWCCAECFNQEVNNIDDCPEGLTVEEVAEMVDKKVRVDHGVATEKKKSTKPRTTKTSDEKKVLFNEIWGLLEGLHGENAEIIKENKLILVKSGEKTFKIDLIEQRLPKVK